MEKCKKCLKLLKSMVYPDRVGGYKTLLRTEILSVYECEECGRKIMNSHKRTGYQTEYLPVNSLITDKEYEEMKILGQLDGSSSIEGENY